MKWAMRRRHIFANNTMSLVSQFIDKCFQIKALYIVAYDLLTGFYTLYLYLDIGEEKTPDMGKDMENTENPHSRDTMREKRVKDLMLDLGTLEHISPETKVAEAVRMLREKWQSLCPAFLLVVDEIRNKEEILGVLSMDDILSHMQPSAEPMEELPIFWQGQFHEECEAILEKQAGEVMLQVTHVIHQSGTLMEALHLTNSGKVDWLPVVEKGEVVGILIKEDLFKEVVAMAERSG